MFTSLFVQQNGLGGAVPGGEGALYRAWLSGHGWVYFVERIASSCTLIFLFSIGSPGEAVQDIGREGQGLNEPVQGTSDVEETEG
jgi:hypothetical protein